MRESEKERVRERERERASFRTHLYTKYTKMVTRNETFGVTL